MSNKKLQEQAKALGIKDFETLNDDQLKAAIEAAEAFNELVKKAELLGIENAKELTADELEKTIIALENTVLNAKVEAFKTVLGFDGDLSPEEIEKAVTEKLASYSSKEEVAEVKAPEGKTDKTHKAKDGKNYGFTSKAPEAFRFAGVVKNQKEWIEDKDSMEIMIQGNLSYVELKKSK